MQSSRLTSGEGNDYPSIRWQVDRVTPRWIGEEQVRRVSLRVELAGTAAEDVKVVTVQVHWVLTSRTQ